MSAPPDAAPISRHESADPQTTRRPRRLGLERREEILKAARQEFANTGFAGTTVRQIAAAADVHDAIIYRHFTTKEQLFDEAVAAPLEQAVARSFAPVAASDDVRAVSERFMTELLAAMRDVSPLLIAMLGEYERGTQFYRDRFEPALARLEEAINTNLKLWPHRTFDPHLLVRVAWGTCWFLTLDEHHATDATLDPDTLGPELVSIIFDGLRTRETE